ncbi:ComF family protein [soil metagenome]
MIASLLFGERCLLCERAAGVLCADCRLDLAAREALRLRCPQCAEAVAVRSLAPCHRCVTHATVFDQTICGADYAVPVDGIDRALKYRRHLAGARLLATLIVDAVERRPVDRPQLLTAVPLSRPRLAERGYNQAWLIARSVAHGLRLPLVTRALQRRRPTVALTRLGASERREAIADAFVAGDARRVEGRTVGLVDDVMTTGATMDAAARVLKAMGASRVIALPALRTPVAAPELH